MINIDEEIAKLKKIVSIQDKQIRQLDQTNKKITSGLKTIKAEMDEINQRLRKR